MENYNTFAETEALLLTTIKLPGRSIKEIAASTGLSPRQKPKRFDYGAIEERVFAAGSAGVYHSGLPQWGD